MPSMTIRNERPSIPHNYTHIISHPQLMVQHEKRGFFPDWHPKVSAIEVGTWNNITFRENTTDDELTYHLREVRVKKGQLTGLELVVGTVKTGNRIYLAYEESRSDNGAIGDQIDGYYYWRAINIPDNNIAIRSTREARSYNILDMSRDDGKGYFAPIKLEISLEQNGFIILTPIYPAEEFPPERFRPNHQLPE